MALGKRQAAVLQSFVESRATLRRGHPIVSPIPQVPNASPHGHRSRDQKKGWVRSSSVTENAPSLAREHNTEQRTVIFSRHGFTLCQDRQSSSTCQAPFCHRSKVRERGS